MARGQTRHRAHRRAHRRAHHQVHLHHRHRLIWKGDGVGTVRDRVVVNRGELPIDTQGTNGIDSRYGGGSWSYLSTVEVAEWIKDDNQRERESAMVERDVLMIFFLSCNVRTLITHRFELGLYLVLRSTSCSNWLYLV
jgi:hypothetical protein